VETNVRRELLKLATLPGIEPGRQHHAEASRHLLLHRLLSGGVVSPKEVTNTPDFKKKVKLVFCSCGSFATPDNINSNHEALDKLGIKNVAYVSPNTRHEFQTWRRSLHEMAPLLFN
jgi:hypothetical protein